MILWNTSNKEIESRYDGKFFIFLPNEKKEIYDKDCALHLLSAMTDFGLVHLSDGISKEQEQQLLIKGIRNRWKMLHRVVSSYATMNKEREAAKLGPVPPTDAVFEAAKEAKQLLNRLQDLEKEKVEAINEYLNTSSASVEDELDNIQESVSIEPVKAEVASPTKRRGR